jgi:hypothetical protein
MHLRRTTTLMALSLLAACAHRSVARPALSFSKPDPHGSAPARYVAVHVDHLQPKTRAGFEDARRVWLGVLAQHHTTDGRGLFLQTGDGGFLSLVPLHQLADLDRRGASSQAALASLDPADQRRYDEASDKRLAPPHRSEIWRFDPSLSYGVTDPMVALSTAAWGKMIVEELDPAPAGDDYEAAWGDIKKALTTGHYPLFKVAYWSTYGTGDLVTFWLSHSQQEFIDTAPMENAVAEVRGREASESLFSRMHKVVTSSESIDVIPRLDLSSEPL